MERIKYWYWLNNIKGIGCKTATKLLDAFEDIESLYKATNRALEQSNIMNKQQIESFIYSRNSDEIKHKFEQVKKKQIEMVSIDMDTFPSELKQIYDCPLLLYYKGQLPDRKQISVAVVGARNCSEYGRQIAKKISSGLAASQVSVISGLARGVDSAAHWGALKSSYKTYAVLGCGVDICYPKENNELYEQIIANGGLISEYPPGTQPKAAFFPMRNRIIAGISKGILVVEARKKSGSLITAYEGLNMGKDIFAVPGRITDPLSEGCNELILSGAKLVRGIEDILNEYNISVHHNKKINISLDNSEKVVYSSICLVPKSLEEILSESNMPIGMLMKILISLEMKGAIHQVGKNQYVLNI